MPPVAALRFGIALVLRDLARFNGAMLGHWPVIDWLRAAIAHSDREDETQWPNLESDASRVQILTLHKSKGLEFPLVFLPFAGIGRSNGGKARVLIFTEYEDTGRYLVEMLRMAFAGTSIKDYVTADQLAEIAVTITLGIKKSARGPGADFPSRLDRAHCSAAGESASERRAPVSEWEPVLRK